PPPRRKIVIPLGLPDHIRGASPLASPPPPRAIFASNPVRGLAWLIDVWKTHIRPAVPRAELHIYGMRRYRYAYGDGRHESEVVRRLTDGQERHGIHLQLPAPPLELAVAMRGSRVMLYPGHKSEMFCLSAAEAQALGVPAVFCPIAVLPERVSDGVT